MYFSTVYFFSVKVSSVKLSEQKCQPRPVVVQETQGYRPFHVELFRCAGTCDEKIPPKQKPCSVSHSQVILLEVRDPLSGKPATIKVDNHTSCHCQCDLKCKWDQGETPDEENCRCNIEPTAEETRGEKTTGEESFLLLIF